MLGHRDYKFVTVYVCCRSWMTSRYGSSVVSDLMKTAPLPPQSPSSHDPNLCVTCRSPASPTPLICCPQAAHLAITFNDQELLTIRKIIIPHMCGSY